MKRLSFSLAALILLTGFVRAQETAREAVQSELRAFIAELSAALAARDRAALERLYADEFIFIHALGPPIDKATHIAQAMATPPGRAPPMPSFDRLLVFGDVAILRTPVEGRFGTTIYVRRSGQWQLLQIQGTPVPLSGPAVDVSTDVLQTYAGRYQQDNGLFVTISLETAGLALQVDGRQKLPMSARSETQFQLPAGAGEITFSKGADGRVAYEFRRGTGPVVRGIRVP